MIKVEIILGIIARSIAINAFLMRAIVNVRQGRLLDPSTFLKSASTTP